MKFEKYFDSETMSVHLKEGTYPTAKKGLPGKWKLVKIDEEILNYAKIKEIAEEIIDQTNHDEKTYLEIEREGSSIVQSGNYRIVIVRKPFSDGLEITIVRPVARLKLKEYNLDEKLNQRLTTQADGILISGSPGEGKTTFARALAEYFADNDKIVKTIESPRDMLLDSKVTQYSLTKGEHGEIHDVLLLSRPDNTFFDEMRTTEDFQLYADLRLAGIGMVGIVHATSPVDAIQRFIGRIEMGTIPQVIDTVVFIKGGFVDKILTLKMMVKVPSGMTEADLARPIVEVRDFINGKLEYEIYSYGEHTIVIPVEKKERKVIWEYAAEKVKKYLQNYSHNCEVQFVSDNRAIILIENEIIPKIIGTGGKVIEKIEKDLGLHLDVRALNKEQQRKGGRESNFEIEVDKKNITLYFGKKVKEQEIALYDHDDLIMQAQCSKKGTIKLSRKSALGKTIEQSHFNKTLKATLLKN